MEPIALIDVLLAELLLENKLSFSLGKISCENSFFIQTTRAATFVSVIMPLLVLLATAIDEIGDKLIDGKICIGFDVLDVTSTKAFEAIVAAVGDDSPQPTNIFKFEESA